MATSVRPFTLVILDGFAFRADRHGNAVAQAHTPCLTQWLEDYPHCQLASSGTAVGLPEGQMGNSEVGHQNLGAGRIIYQDLTRIDAAIEESSFFTNPVLLETLQKVRQNDGTLHLMGLVSPGGVHSRDRHLYALLKMAKEQGVPRTVVHAFLDGRDTPPKSARGFLADLLKEMKALETGQVATVSGRYFAMDRDKRWGRLKKSWDCLVHGQAEHSVGDPLEAIDQAYDRGETDEFVVPTVVLESGEPVATMRGGDGVIHFNFRADRARQLTWAFTQEDFDGFDRGGRPTLSAFTTLTSYEPNSPVSAAFPPEYPTHVLGEVISNAGLKQFRCAETEKYAHVTYFFNGGQENVFAGEDRLLIPSNREVATYDEYPEMSASDVTDELVARIASKEYAFLVVNYANPDMVGHTGDLSAATRAVEAVDTLLGRVVEAAKTAGVVVAITADHGNCEEMIAPDGEPHTAHTTRPVPFLLIDDQRRAETLRSGVLKDVAPTVLEVMGLDVPEEMTGQSLLKKDIS